MELSARYIHDRKLPDKAIDVIDETGASQMLLPENKRKKTIGIKEIEAAIATMARIPAQDRVEGRRRGAEAISTSRRSSASSTGRTRRSTALSPRSSWRAPACAMGEKPIGSYLFSGPTGVGKTEVRASSRRRSASN